MQEATFPWILFGGDYNPDQWDFETLIKDMDFFKRAKINTLVLPVFSWAKLEPRDGEYDFRWLDEILSLIHQHGMSVILATSTVSQPAWMSIKYPDILPVDIGGRKRTHGMRAFFCVNSVSYRKKARALVEVMVKRYKNHPALLAWHVANEYGTYCYCEHCQDEFRSFLQKRYVTIEELNERWMTSFWGRTVYEFSEIMIPSELNDDHRFNPAIQLDYLRFMTKSTIDCFENEAQILRENCPNVPVYTNISGFIKKINQFEMIPHMSFAAWDNYPNPQDEIHIPAMKHDIMRGSLSGRPFIVAEQSPNQQNWQPYNKLKRPNEMRLLAYQGIAHGADGSLFFQMRQSIAGQEKFHGAFISHGGKDDTRIFKEFCQLGNEFSQLGNEILGSRVQAKVAMLFDWENWWTLELASGPSKDLNYLSQIASYYKPFHNRSISIDIVKTSDSLDAYSIVLMPLLYMMKEGIQDKLHQYVSNGGILIGTYLSGVSDENDRCVFGERPGPLKDLFGLWVEETDALYPEERNEIVQGDKKWTSSFLCDRIHVTSAKIIAVYGRDFYAGEACITVNNFGKGEAWYFGTMPEQEYLQEFVDTLIKRNLIAPDFDTPVGVEAVLRKHPVTGDVFIHLQNHTGLQQQINLRAEDPHYDLLQKKRVEDSLLILPPMGVAILTYR